MYSPLALNMWSWYILTLAIVLSLSLTDASSGAPAKHHGGHLAAAGTGTTHLIKGHRPGLAASFSASAPVSNSVLFATKRSGALEPFKNNKSGSRKMLAGGGGRASGNNNAAATGSTYLIEGQRNELSASLTSDAISKAVASGKAFMASAVGTKAALSATDRSVALKTFDKVHSISGNRKLQQNRDRGELVALSLQTARASIERAVGSSNLATGVKAAVKKNLEVAKLSNRQSARSADFTDGRRLLQQNVQDQVSTAASANQLAGSTIPSPESQSLHELQKELRDLRRMYTSASTEELMASN